jgi:ABC-type antimicrobial peptide transport system, permease component
MAIFGVAGCTALLLFGLGLKDSVNDVSDWMYRDLNVYEKKINIKEEALKEDVAAISERYKGQWIQETGVELKTGGKKESGSLTVLDKGEQINFHNNDRHNISLPSKGIGISSKMAEVLNIQLGDTLQWRIYGEKDWQQSEITAVYRTPMGQGIAMKKEEYEAMGRSFKPTALLTNDEVQGAEKLAAVKSVQDKQQLKSGFNDMLESMKAIIAILILAAVILGSVVLYNLGGLSFTERIREFATLKVLGFFPKQIRSLLQRQNMWLTVIGIIVGIPAGFILMNFMLSTMSESTDMMPKVTFISLLISIMGTFIVSMLINMLLSRKLKGIDMITSLKSVE